MIAKDDACGSKFVELERQLKLEDTDISEKGIQLATKT
jgi:hypothetical protein